MQTMENIRDEEQRSLTHSPRRRVANAYDTTIDRHKNLKKYSFWIVAFIAFLIFSTGSSSGETRKQKRAKKLRNKAETMPEAEVAKLSQANQNMNMNEKYAQLNDAHAKYEDEENNSFVDEGEESEDLDIEVMKAHDYVEMAETDEVDSNNSMLASAVQAVEEGVKFYVGKVFGYGDDDSMDDDDESAMDAGSETSADIQLTEDQLDIITKKISERLERDVKTEFRAKADAVREEKETELERVITEDKGAQMSTSEIVNDIKEAKNVMVEDLKDEIDNAAKNLKDDIPQKVKKIRNEVVEEVTGKKLDDIENKKRARKERRKGLIKKFNEISAQQHKNDAKNLYSNKPDRSKKSDDESKSVRGPPKYEAKGVKYPVKKPKYSEPSADEEKPVHKKKKYNRFKNASGSKDEDKVEPSDEEKDSASKKGKKRNKAKNGEEKQSDDESGSKRSEDFIASGRRNKDESEDSAEAEDE